MDGAMLEASPYLQGAEIGVRLCSLCVPLRMSRCCQVARNPGHLFLHVTHCRIWEQNMAPGWSCWQTLENKCSVKSLLQLPLTWL